MIDTLRDIVVANGMMMIHVEKGEIIITAYQKELKLPLVDDVQPPEWKDLEMKKEGTQQWVLTSDMFDVFEEGLSIDTFSAEVAVELLSKMFEKSIQYIAKIIIEEGVAVLIVNSYNDETKYLLSTIGLLEDARIVFAEIKEKGKELTPC